MPPTWSWRRCLPAWLVAALTLVTLLGGAAPAFAFGTIRGLFQNNEHEHITRVALECSPTYLRSGEYARPSSPLEDVPGRCFERETTRLLAGNFAELPEQNLVRVGAVGASDMDAFFDSIPHCTDGDFLPGGGYPQSRARAYANLAACRAYLLRHFEAGLLHARTLVDEKTGAIVAAEATRECRFIDGPFALKRFHLFLGRARLNPNVQKSWRALGAHWYLVPRLMEFFKSQPALFRQSGKCRTLSSLGRVLHLVQDFYAHSNWTDRADGTRRIGVKNPPGLRRSTRAPLLNPMTTSTVITPGLITACYTLPILNECRGRIDHDADLGKDKGTIVEEYAQKPPWVNTFRVTRVSDKHPRGLHDENFVRAVRGAVAESRGVWKDFGTKLRRRYPRDAETMLCILTRDGDAKYYCDRRVFRYRIAVEMTGGSSSWAHESYRRSDPRSFDNYRGSGKGSSSWTAEWHEVQITLNRTDRRVYSALRGLVSDSFTGRASGAWTDRQFYNAEIESLRNGYTCRYDDRLENQRAAVRLVVGSLSGDVRPIATTTYDDEELFTLVFAQGPIVQASCQGGLGIRVDPFVDTHYAYDGADSCQFALERKFDGRIALPLRIPIVRLGEARISLVQPFQNTVAGCLPFGGQGDPEEYCDHSGNCWKGTKSRAGTYRVTMTLIEQ